MEIPPAVQAEYKPAVDSPTGPHFVLHNCRDPELNGEFRFEYPNEFRRIQIGARMAEIINAGRDPQAPPLSVEQLPAWAALRAQAVATLEYVITTAPKGWYLKGEDRRPLLAPGAVGGQGDDDAVLEVFEGYLSWARRFRGAVAETGEPAAPSAVVPGGEAGGGAAHRQ